MTPRPIVRGLVCGLVCGVVLALTLPGCADLEEGVPLSNMVTLIVKSQAMPPNGPPDCTEEIVWRVEREDGVGEVMVIQPEPDETRIINSRCTYFSEQLTLLSVEWHVGATNGTWQATCGPVVVNSYFEEFYSAKFVIDDADCFGFDIFSFPGGF